MSTTTRLRTNVAAVAVLVLIMIAVAATVSAATHAIRVPASAAAQLGSLGIQSRHDLDYGSFRWLVVDDAVLQQIEAAGVPHTRVPDAGTVQVQGYRFDPVEDGEPQLPDNLRASGTRPGIHLVQLVGPVRDEWGAELAAAGIRILQYYPHNSYLVWADPAALAGIQAASWVRWQGAFHPAYKINSEVQGRSASSATRR